MRCCSSSTPPSALQRACTNQTQTIVIPCSIHQAPGQPDLLSRSRLCPRSTRPAAPAAAAKKVAPAPAAPAGKRVAPTPVIRKPVVSRDAESDDEEDEPQGFFAGLFGSKWV